MTVETATYISQLNSALPAGTDPKSEGDDHMRLVKASLKATFPNFGAAALAASNTQLDKLVTTFSISSAPSSAVTVDASGNVGIGTSNVELGAGYTNLVVAGSTGSILQVQNAANTYAAGLSLDSGGTRMGNRRGAGPLVLTYGANVEGIRIETTGHVISTLRTAAPSLASNSTMAATIPSDSVLRIFVRGSDGVTRSVDLALS